MLAFFLQELNKFYLIVPIPPFIQQDVALLYSIYLKMLAFFLLQELDKLYLIVPDATIHTTGLCCVCVRDGRGTIWSNKLSIPEHFRRTKKVFL